MRKPKFLAMTLAVALVAGAVLEAPVAVRAEETVAAAQSVSQGDNRPSESQGDNPAPSPAPAEIELVEPDEVGWEDGWKMHFVVPNLDVLAECGGSVCIGFWQDGECRFSDNYEYSYFDSAVNLIGISDDIYESGVYYFTVKECAEINGVYTETKEVRSAEKEYVVPAERLATMEAPVWDTENTGVFYFKPISGDVKAYQINGYQDNGEYEWYAFSRRISSPVSGLFSTIWTTEDGRIAVDMSEEIQRLGEGKYRVSISALSNDIDTVANGYTSEKSAYLDTSKNAEQVAAVITDAVSSSNSAAEAVEIIRQNTSKNALSTAMQTSSEVLEQIKTLEQKYLTESNVTVSKSVSDQAAALGVDTSKVSMVGAAFNANPNSTVSLDISVPETKVSVPTGYKDGVQLDIKLNGASSPDGTLEMPITITMPAPAGVDLNKLSLWHYHGDNREAVVFKNNNDGTITFTVTSFSVFLFTEEKTGDNQPSGGQTGSDSTANNSNSSSSSSTSSTQTVTEEKKAPVAIEYVVKRGDNMAKIARRHGLTLGQLIALNPQVKNPARIYAGQVLIVGYTNGEAAAADAANAEYYIVQRGDSLFKIAVKNKLTLLELKVLNPNLFAQRYIFAGQKVRVK